MHGAVCFLLDSGGFNAFKFETRCSHCATGNKGCTLHTLGFCIGEIQFMVSFLVLDAIRH